MEYLEIDPKNAYEMMNTGGIIWVCTKGNDERYNLTPISWSCPLDFEPTSRILFICNPSNTCFTNLSHMNAYTIALPSFTQLELVKETGMVSGADTDKYLKFGIEAFPSHNIDTRIPTGVSGWLECRLIRTIAEGSVSIVIGEVITAFAKPDAWKERLHYVTAGTHYRPLLL
jgi:flavin reductase (DIM6/NTAB) family NADH-FMN oxidoreductase RutF